MLDEFAIRFARGCVGALASGGTRRGRAVFTLQLTRQWVPAHPDNSAIGPCLEFNVPLNSMYLSIVSVS